jgi:transcriptional antiterminator RfaH
MVLMTNTVKTDLKSGVESELPMAIPLAFTEWQPMDTGRSDWWVAHTKARHEKALAADLEKMRIEHFLPLVNVRSKSCGRVFERMLPLFPCYLFVCGGEQERYETLMTHRVANVIPVVDQDRIRRELRQIYQIVASQQAVDFYPAIKCGQRCRIVNGALAGIEGVVLRRRDVCRVYVGVEVLGQSAELEIDPALLEVIE